MGEDHKALAHGDLYGVPSPPAPRWHSLACTGTVWHAQGLRPPTPTASLDAGVVAGWLFFPVIVYGIKGK